MNWYKKSDENKHISDLKQVGKSINHCGDYGLLWWNESANKVLWIAGDADSNDYDDSETIIRRFKKLPFVKQVEVEYEMGDPQSRDWKRIKYR